MSRSRLLLLGGPLIVATVAVAVVAAVLAGRGGRAPSSSLPPLTSAPSAGSSAASGSPAGIGHRRVWLIVLENRSYDQLIGNGDAPFLNSLAEQYGRATDYHAVARPSQPNYLALLSGSTQGVRDNGSHDLNAMTLLDQLEAAGHTWHVFAENVPPGCYRGDTASDGRDGSGTYARKHEPAISFVSISANPDRCSRISDLTSFTPDAADFNLVIPNLCHDMHDCSTQAADTWLSTFVPRITGSSAFRDGGLLLITVDEAATSDKSQHTMLLFAAQGVAPGTRARERADHYALLRSIQAIFGLDCLAQSCNATAIPELPSP